MEWNKLKRVENKDTNAEFLIHCKLKQNCLDLIILKNSAVWSTVLKSKALNDLARKLKMKTNDYLNRLRDYLDSENVEFQFVDDEFILQYTLNKLKVNYLQCKLTKEQNLFEIVSNLLQNMYDEKNKAIKDISILQEEKNNYELSATSMESKLNEFITRKQRDEEMLYSNFVLVLNEKKARIQHLTELLEAFRHGRATVNPPPKTREKSKSPKVEVKNEVSDSEENEHDYDTDDEKREVNHETEINDRSYTDIPSTSNNFASSLLVNEPQTFHVLPKRMKYEFPTQSTVIQESSRAGSSKEENNTNIKEENTQNTGYNTQDLLDCL